MASTSSSEFDIYPVHLIDAGSMNHKLVSFLFRFNDVLDVDKLHTALIQLMDHGDWRKLGGRLQRNLDGKLELRVPQRFTDQQPAVAFTKEDFSAMSIREHPLGKHLPEAGPTAYSQSIAGDMDFRKFAIPHDFPSEMKDFIASQAPQIALLTTSFNDATLVSLIWPHTLFDGAGFSRLLQAWSLKVNGRDDEIPTVFGAKEDILEALDNDDQSATDRFDGPKRLRGLNFILFIVMFIWHRLFYPPRDTRTIFLPRVAADHIILEAKKDAGETFITEGDAILAWATRSITAAEPKAHPTTVLQLANGRGRLQCLARSHGVYLQNIVSLVFCHLTSDVSHASLGQIAVLLRRQTVRQTSEDQIKILLRELRECERHKRKFSTLNVETPHSRVIMSNNLTKSAFMQVVDFSAAVIRCGQGDTSRQNPPGTAVNYLHLIVKGHLKAVDNIYILGKDSSANYWLMATVSDKAWAKFNESLAHLPSAC